MSRTSLRLVEPEARSASDSSPDEATIARRSAPIQPQLRAKDKLTEQREALALHGAPPALNVSARPWPSQPKKELRTPAAVAECKRKVRFLAWNRWNGGARR